MVTLFLIVGFSSLLVSWLSVWKLCNPKSPLYVIDVPNERSLHVKATPRTGGLGILLGVLVGILILAWVHQVTFVQLAIFLTMAGLAFLGFLDDRLNLSSALRFSGHLIAAGVTIWWLGPIESIAFANLFTIPLGIFAIPFSILFVVWMINLYNFMDGMDGFSGGMTLIGFSTLSILFAFSNNTEYCLACIIPGAAALGFLAFNFPPAKIFMGDAGSTSIGYLAAALAIFAHNSGQIPLWIFVTLFSPFILDSTVTLLTRVVRKERFWEAHRTHYYQRLVISGKPQLSVVLVEYGLMLVVAVLATIAITKPASQNPIFIGWLILFVSLGFWINTHIAKGKRENSLSQANPSRE